MDDEALVKKILKRLRKNDATIENDSLDLKRTWYTPKANKRWQDEFAKDICGIANSLGENIGYLIFGIDENNELHLNDITLEKDEAEIQDIIRDQVKPIPKVHFSSVNIKGCKILVVSIESSLKEMPYFALKKQNGSHYMYIRRGSQTDLCKREDITRLMEIKRNHQIDAQIIGNALNKLKNLEYKSRRDLNKNDVLPFLNKLDEFTEDYNERVYSKILTILKNVSRLFYHYNNSVEIAHKLSLLCRNTLPFANYNYPSNSSFSKDEKKLLERAIQLGHDIAYQGARRLQSNQVINEGLDILWVTLRLSELNNYSNLKTKSEDAFETIKKWVNKKDLNDAIRWISFRRKDALAIDDSQKPTYPKDIAEKFMS